MLSIQLVSVNHPKISIIFSKRTWMKIATGFQPLQSQNLGGLLDRSTRCLADSFLNKAGLSPTISCLLLGIPVWIHIRCHAGFYKLCHDYSTHEQCQNPLFYC